VIRLTRLNGSEIYLNADLVSTVESHHDTVLTLVDGKMYVVVESAEVVIAQITNYRASVLAATERHLIAADAIDAPADEVGRLLHLHPVTDGGS
jgi:flagellar protein FlbD